jgi:hypothetical protein
MEQIASDMNRSLLAESCSCAINPYFQYSENEPCCPLLSSPMIATVTIDSIQFN